MTGSDEHLACAFELGEEFPVVGFDYLIIIRLEFVTRLCLEYLRDDEVVDHGEAIDEHRLAVKRPTRCQELLHPVVSLRHRDFNLCFSD